MALYNWSQTAASNATADPAINWAEGQAPSSVNDSSRAEMAVIKKYVDDISGAIVTTGTSTAYAVSSYQVFDTLAHLSGQVIAFTPHITNGATVTLSVDGLGAKPLRTATNVELQSSMLSAGTPYVALYNNSDAAFYLHGNLNTCGVPLLGGMDYWDTVAPSSAFIFPAGQALSRTTYASAFARWGTTFGSGNGSTTFNVPDKTGRVSAMYEAAGASRLTSTYFGHSSGQSGATFGAVGGGESQTLTLAQTPTGITSNGSNSISVSGTTAVNIDIDVISGNTPGTGTAFNAVGTRGTVTTNSSGINAIAVTSNNTSGSAHEIVQPTILCNYIIRVL